jgi:hypothetical protein
MKGKYITTGILLACLSKHTDKKKDIHAQLKATIAQHKLIMQQLEQLFTPGWENNSQTSGRKAA